MMFAIAGLFVFASCGNKTQEPAAVENAPQKECQHKKDSCCHEMTEAEKAEMEAWKNWDQQTPEKKQELITKKKECLDKKIAEKEARQAEMQAKFNDFKTKLAGWDKLTIDEQKSLIEEYCAISCHPKHHGDKQGCCKKQDGNAPQHKSCKDHKTAN